MSTPRETQERIGQPTETLVDVENLKKYYGGEGFLAGPPVKAVDGVNFTIQKGETLGLVGESGCGKSTLGRTLIQLENATEGTVSFDGIDITELSGSELKEWRKNAQIVFQDPQSSLNDRMTVGQIIREPLDAHDWETPNDRRNRVLELLNEVGLREEHYYRYPHQFSGGQRQRVGIARALALEPDFLVLDEPVSALDVSVQAKIIRLLEDLQEEFGLTYLFIAHDLSVVRHICDRVAVMYLGKIMELGETEELFQNPANPYTQALLSAIPRPDPTASGSRITLPGTPPSPRDPPTGCQFSTRCPAKIRPEKYEHLDEAIWDGLERFREVIRERSRMELGMIDRVNRGLGRFSKYDDIEETVQDMFGDLDIRSESYDVSNLEIQGEDAESVDLTSIGETERHYMADLDLPPNVAQHVATVTEMVKEGKPMAAREYLHDEFGSVCDRDRPELHDIGSTGRKSYCHRHDSAYEDVDPVIERRTTDQ